MLSSADQGTWSWRAKLAWALLGPSIVVLIQVEAVFIIADALGALDLRVDASRRTAAIAFAALVLVTAAQLSTGLWRRCRDARKDLLDRRLAAEMKLLAGLHPAQPGTRGGPQLVPFTPSPAVAGPDPAESAQVPSKPGPIKVMRGSLRVLTPDVRIRSYRDLPDWRFRGIVERFGLEPTWAYQTLDELGVPAARALSQRTQLLDARTSGDTTALAVALASFAAAAVVILPTASKARWIDAVAIVLVIYLLAVARLLVSRRLRREFLGQEEQYYPQLERLLELNRFELYKALAIEAPRDAREEKDGQLGEWRQGRGDVQYVQPEAPGDGDVREQVQGLTDLLKGPELVRYEGYVSWELRDEQVRLTFATAPVAGATGDAGLQVEGSDSESHAPFDISASSEDVVLTPVRAAVQAPVDGRAKWADFNLAPRPGSRTRRAPVIWFEIRQRGRFIQLLRVSALPNGEPAAEAVRGNQGPAQAGGPARARLRPNGR
jgi:hypothetical protein